MGLKSLKSGLLAILCIFLLFSLFVFPAAGFGASLIPDGYVIRDTSVTPGFGAREYLSNWSLSEQSLKYSPVQKFGNFQDSSVFNPDTSEEELEPEVTTADDIISHYKPERFSDLDSHIRDYSASRYSTDRLQAGIFSRYQPAAGESTLATVDSVPTSEDRAVVEASNRFAFDLYDQLAYDPQYRNANIFFSPWSISSAFAIECSLISHRTSLLFCFIFQYQVQEKYK